MSVLCLRLPRFALACELAHEQTASSALRCAPVVVADAAGAYVVEASAEAEAHGVQREMPLRQALSYCPTLATLEVHPTRQAELARQLLETLQAFTPLVEVAEPGTLFGDMRGLERHYRQPAELARAVLARVPRQVGAQVGIAARRFTAQVAAELAERRAYTIVPSAGDAEFLAAQPLERAALDEELRRRLMLLGLRSLGQIAALPRSALAAQFGPEGAWLWDAASGFDPRPIDPLASTPQIVEALRAEPPLVSRPAIEHGVRQLLARIVRQPDARGRPVRALGLRVVQENEQVWERTQICREPTANAERLWQIVRPLLDAARWSAPVLEIHLTLLDLAFESGRQSPLFAERVRERRRLEEMVRELHARYRTTPIKQLVEVEPWHRLPERRYALLDYDP